MVLSNRKYVFYLYNVLTDDYPFSKNADFLSFTKSSILSSQI